MKVEYLMVMHVVVMNHIMWNGMVWCEGNVCEGKKSTWMNEKKNHQVFRNQTKKYMHQGDGGERMFSLLRGFGFSILSSHFTFIRFILVIMVIYSICCLWFPFRRQQIQPKNVQTFKEKTHCVRWQYADWQVAIRKYWFNRHDIAQRSHWLAGYLHTFGAITISSKTFPLFVYHFLSIWLLMCGAMRARVYFSESNQISIFKRPRRSK